VDERRALERPPQQLRLAPGEDEPEKVAVSLDLHGAPPIGNAQALGVRARSSACCRARPRAWKRGPKRRASPGTRPTTRATTPREGGRITSLGFLTSKRPRATRAPPSPVSVGPPETVSVAAGYCSGGAG